MSEGRIHSNRVIMVEGDAGEFIPNEESAAGMHGFVVVVSPDAAGERFLDLVWRFAMLYAGMPGWLSRSAKVAKMVEAVMGKERRQQKPARSSAFKGGPANRTQPHRSALPDPVVGSSQVSNRKPKRAVEGAKSQPGPGGRSKAKARKRN